MYRVDMTIVRREMSRQAASSLANLAFGAIKNKFDAKKRDLIKEFQDNEISQEITAGSDNPQAGNISATLDGKGNLFTFIGFNQGSDPVGEVVESLEEGIELQKKPLSISENGKEITVEFGVSVPTIKELDEVHLMPEWSNLGWITAIKKGISGFRSYIYWKEDVGRSGGGLQAKKKKSNEPVILRDGKYSPPKYYLPDMLRNFIRKLKTGGLG